MVRRHSGSSVSIFGKKKKAGEESIGSRPTESVPTTGEEPEHVVEVTDDDMAEMQGTAPLQVPKQLKHFEILSEIGRGGMGSVFLARDVSLDREVALKVLSPSLIRNELMVERFDREARAQARISHPNITQIYFVGRDQGCHFFAMELVHGKNLAEILEDEGALPWEKALGYIRQAATGLAAANERGVVHHDVKPSNLILTNEGTVKIADFGLAKQVKRDSRITGTGVITGSPAYMSPEQGRGTATDHRSDIYSLGASLFHLLADRPPFESDSAVGTIVQQITEEPPRLIDIDPSIPRRVSELVGCCLEKNPSKRFQDYEKLLRAIDEAMPRKITPAGWYARFSAVLFDLIVIAVVSVFLGGLAKAVFYAAYFVLLESLFAWTPGKRVLRLTLRKLDGRRAFPARIGLRFLLAHWFFFAAGGVFWLYGTTVESYEAFTQSNPITSALVVILFLLYVLGLVIMALGRRKRAFHDSFTGTIVMYDIH